MSMKILIVFLLLNGEKGIVETELKPYEFCSDKSDEFSYYKENENYKEGNGQVWIYRYFEGNKVGAIYCLTIDKKYLVSYYDPEYEKNKKKEENE